MPELSPSPSTNPVFVPERVASAREWLHWLEGQGIQVPPGVRAIVRDYERLAGLLDDVDHVLARSTSFTSIDPGYDASVVKRWVAVPMQAWERLCIARKAIGS